MRARVAVARFAVATLATGLGLAVAWAEVITDGPAADGSVRGTIVVVSPSDAPAKPAIDPGSTSRPAVVNPLDSSSVEAVSPSSLAADIEPLKPGSTELQAISPREHPALPALSPGESRSREVYNPRDYGARRYARPPASPTVQPLGPASQGSIRQPPEATFPSDAAALQPFEGAMDTSSFGRGAAAGASGRAAAWISERVMPRSIFEGWLCKTRDFVKVGDETLQVCNGVWVRRLLWGGQSGYVPIYPPDGAELDRLPGTPETVTVAGKTYSYASGTFYERVSESGAERYRVVRAPVGAVVSSLPRLTLDAGSGLLQFDSAFFRAKGGRFTVVAAPL